MRLFTGISIESPVRENLERALARMRPTAPCSWTPDENLHITAKFVGEWPEGRLPELKSALGRVEAAGELEISVVGFGFLPDARHPRTFYAAVGPNPRLNDLVGKIDDALITIGVPGEDRPYTPHVTLARLKGREAGEMRGRLAAIRDAEPGIDFGTFRATQLHLYASTAGSGHSVYRRLAGFPLAERSRP